MNCERWEMKRIRSLPRERLQVLIRESRGEGFRFLGRLSDDWQSGANRFDKPHEALFTMVDGDSLLAICGLNVDPYHANPRVARLRHMYVRPFARRRGVGRDLLRRVLEHAASSSAFDRVRLRTDTTRAARFYEAMGFRRCPGDGSATHEIEI